MGPFRAHVVADRDLVVLVDKVISMDIVERHGSGGTSCRGHGEKVVSWCGGREERKTQVGWGDLEGECVPRLFIHGQNYATPDRGRQRGRLWKNQIACYVGSQMNEITEFCRALDGGEYGAQCATEVKQSSYGTCRVMWLLDWEAPPPRKNSVHNQSVE